MQPFRNLLVVVEVDTRKDEASSVIARAARLARQSGASITLAASLEDLPWYAHLVLPKADSLRAALAQQYAESLETLAQPLRLDGLEVSTKIIPGRPHLELVREVIRGSYDLLIKDAEPNESILFGSTDMHLLRSCPCPLWLFKPGHAGRVFGRVLAAVDPAPPPDDADLLRLKIDLTPKDETLDVRILELAGLLASEEGARLDVVHAWSVPGERLVRSDAMLAQEEVERFIADAREEARKALQRLLDRNTQRPEQFAFHLIKGDPANVITEFVEAHQIDLIVMGTVARIGIPGLLIGNTAETILQRVNCSVLAVKPDGFVSPITLTD
jgi:nucleotide-binding universal stress UspA family protein